MQALMAAGASTALLAGTAGAAGTFACYFASAALTPLLFQRFSSLKKRDQLEWHTKLAHVAHALACTALVAATLTQRGGAFQAPVATPTVLYAVTPLSTATLCFSLGYFLADIAVMLCTVSQAPMLAHHLGGLAALLATLTTGECHFYGLLLLSTEVTTPFICARWYLHKAGRRKTQLFLINGICIVAGWVLSRILLFVYIFSHMWEHRREMARLSLRVQVAAPGITLTLFVLNCFWFRKILFGVAKAFSGSRWPAGGKHA